MTQNVVYEDNLVEISDDSILIKNYYLPFIGSRRVPFSKIQYVTAEKPSFWNGKFRIWGTGNFAAWFPIDFARSKRDTIFTITLVGDRISIGFTVSDSKSVSEILRQKGLIRQATA